MMTTAQTPTKRLYATLTWLLPGGMLFLYAWLNYRRYFPPFSLFIQGIVVLILTVWGVWHVVQRKGLPRTPLTMPLLALLGSTIISTVLSIDLRRSFDGLVVTLALILCFLLVCDLLLSGVSPRIFETIILCTATLALGLGLWIAAGSYWSWWQTSTGDYSPFLIQYRLFGVTDHPNFLAAMLNIAMPFAAIRLASVRDKPARVGWAVWLCCYVIVLYLTRSRGGYLAASASSAIVVVGLMLQYGLPRKHTLGAWLQQTRPIWATALAYGGLFALLLLGPSITDWLFPATTQSSFTTNASASLSGASRHRFYLWAVAWQMVQDHPLTGSGPLTFPHAFVQEERAVRFWVPGYAHNIFVEILGTQGILGILTLVWEIGAGGGAMLVAWWNQRHLLTQPEPQGWGDNQLRLLAVCAMLSGYFTHALVDMPGKVITNDVLLVIVLALGMHAAGKVYDNQRVLPRWTAAVLLVPLLLIVVFVRYNAGREAMLDAVLSGMRGDWQAAAAAVDEARAADPLHPFYVGQRGYVYSILADPIDEDSIARGQALQSYALSSQVEPPYIPNLLNRMYLLEQTGDTQAANQILQQAIELRQASYWALPYLLMGQHYEDGGKTDDAIESYTLAFKREPQAPDMVACQQRTLCRKLAEAQANDTTSPRAIYQQAQTLLDQGAAQQALDLLEQIPQSSADPLPWLYRTDMHVVLGEYERAAYTLRVAQTLRVNKRYPGTDAHAALSEARLALAQNNQQAAITALEQAAHPQVTRDGYGYGIYRQVGLPGTLQPRLDLLQRTADDLAVYHMLAGLYQQQGQVEDAAWAAQRAAVLAALLEQDIPN